MTRVSILYGQPHKGSPKAILCTEDHPEARARFLAIKAAGGKDGQDAYRTVWLQTSSLPCLHKGVFPTPSEVDAKPEGKTKGNQKS